MPKKNKNNQQPNLLPWVSLGTLLKIFVAIGSVALLIFLARNRASQTVQTIPQLSRPPLRDDITSRCDDLGKFGIFSPPRSIGDFSSFPVSTWATTKQNGEPIVVKNIVNKEIDRSPTQAEVRTADFLRRMTMEKNRLKAVCSVTNYIEEHPKDPRGKNTLGFIYFELGRDLILQQQISDAFEAYLLALENFEMAGQNHQNRYAIVLRLFVLQTQYPNEKFIMSREQLEQKQLEIIKEGFVPSAKFEKNRQVSLNLNFISEDQNSINEKPQEQKLEKDSFGSSSPKLQ
jgi:hypothetical protein